jgi:alpha-tubulin suppressor-like RCC1 family protein
MNIGKKPINAILLLSIIILFTVGKTNCPFKSNRNKIKAGSSDQIYNTFLINAPSALTADVIPYSRIDISWQDNSNNEDGFSIERKSGINGTWTQIVTFGIGAVNYSDTNIGFFVTYYYRVCAVDSIGDKSEYSNEANDGINPVWQAVSVGQFHSAALATDGVIWSWGANGNGQVGIGYPSSYIDTPVPIITETGWNRISCGGVHILALKTDNTLWAWGGNSTGQLGMGDTIYENWEPFVISTNTDWSCVSAGAFYSTAIKTNFTIWSWGYNNYGQLGLNDTLLRTSPNQIGTQSDWVLVSAGYYHTLARKTNNTIWSWGYNEFYHLGLGDSENRNTPSQIGTQSDWSVISAGSDHSVVIKNNGAIYSWGYNWGCQLGLGDRYIDRSTPTQIGTDSDWLFVVAGALSTIALKTNDSLWSWGANDSSSLGLGDSELRKTPSLIGVRTDWVEIKHAYYQGIARDSSNKIWAWGRNAEGQLGLGDTDIRNTPTLIGN